MSCFAAVANGPPAKKKGSLPMAARQLQATCHCHTAGDALDCRPACPQSCGKNGTRHYFNRPDISQNQDVSCSACCGSRMPPRQICTLLEIIMHDVALHMSPLIGWKSVEICAVGSSPVIVRTTDSELQCALMLAFCCKQEVMEHTGRNTTQAVLLGGVILSVAVAAICLWAKIGKPIPWSAAWSRIGSPGRRRGPNRRPMRQHV